MKAVLILDMPSCCNNCPCFDGMEDRSDCKYLEKNIEDILIIDKDCPLKPLPPRREYADESKVYKAGWNDCLDAIVGGKQ
ncbi:MAG: hypothetical protein J6N95_05560 [Bacilli bacterium]|nr:hypothetical protein [Bacilli bacterium]